MSHRVPFLVHSQLYSTTGTWEEWTGVTNYVAAIGAVSRAGNFINTFYFLLDTSITNAYILHSNYSTGTTFKHVKDFRVRLAKELIEDYYSRCRPGRQGSAL